MTGTDHQATLEQLNARRTALRESIVRAQANTETAQKELQRLQTAALEQFGTDDVQKLEALLAQMEIANTQALAQYGENIKAVETELRAARQQLDQQQ